MSLEGLGRRRGLEMRREGWLLSRAMRPELAQKEAKHDGGGQASGHPLNLKSAIEWGVSFREIEGERFEENGTLIKQMSMNDRGGIVADDSVSRSFLGLCDWISEKSTTKGRRPGEWPSTLKWGRCERVTVLGLRSF
jgi:hypothetical protein